METTVLVKKEIIVFKGSRLVIKYLLQILFFRVMKYPTDFQLEMEYWAETGDLDEDELHEVFLI